MRYVYCIDNLDNGCIGYKYFYSMRKAVAYGKLHGFTNCDYCSEWIVSMSIPSYKETTHTTHVTIRKEVVS